MAMSKQDNRCPYCSSNPTSLLDYCDKHRPAQRACRIFEAIAHRKDATADQLREMALAGAALMKSISSSKEDETDYKEV